MTNQKKKRPRDINELAAAIVTEATSDELPTEEEPETTEDGKNPHAVALGRIGGLKGGRARANKLTPEQRQEIARNAAKARWDKK